MENFWNAINCKNNLILTWSVNCVVTSSTTAIQATTFPITDAKLYVPVVTLSTDNNAKLLQQLKSSFTKTTNWNKYHSKVTIQGQNQYLD